VPVLAPATPGDCFYTVLEAFALAVAHMTPVIVLSDGFLANASEPWRLPDLAALPRFPVRFRTDPEGFHPFVRDPVTLARAWAVPGTPGLAHRIGGIERSYDTGHISYDPDNHQKMTDVRAAKIAGVANDVPLQTVTQGDEAGDLAVVGWGSTYGAIQEAVRALRAEGRRVSHVHVRYLSPFPRNLGEVLARFPRLLVPELNAGQLVAMLRARYLVPAVGLNKVAGRPFRVAEVVDAVRAHLEDR
jgi:2-oxoglutarate ferredoxin oxidoreductase subunit alpha